MNKKVLVLSIASVISLSAVGSSYASTVNDINTVTLDSNSSLDESFNSRRLSLISQNIGYFNNLIKDQKVKDEANSLKNEVDSFNKAKNVSSEELSSKTNVIESKYFAILSKNYEKVKENVRSESNDIKRKSQQRSSIDSRIDMNSAIETFDSLQDELKSKSNVNLDDYMFDIMRLDEVLINLNKAYDNLEFEVPAATIELAIEDANELINKNVSNKEFLIKARDDLQKVYDEGADYETTNKILSKLLEQVGEGYKAQRGEKTVKKNDLSVLLDQLKVDIVFIESLDKDKYIDSSYKALEKELDKAKDYVNGSKHTKEALIKHSKDLDEKFRALEYKSIFDRLDDTIKMAEKHYEFNKDNKGLKDAIDRSKVVYEDKNSSQKQVDNAVNEILIQMDMAKYKDLADYSKLENAILNLNKYKSDNKDKLDEESLNKINKKLEEAENIYIARSSSQEDVDKIENELKSFISNLTGEKVDDNTNEGDIKESDSNKKDEKEDNKDEKDDGDKEKPSDTDSSSKEDYKNEKEKDNKDQPSDTDSSSESSEEKDKKEKDEKKDIPDTVTVDNDINNSVVIVDYEKYEAKGEDNKKNKEDENIKSKPLTKKKDPIKKSLVKKNPTVKKDSTLKTQKSLDKKDSNNSFNKVDNNEYAKSNVKTGVTSISKVVGVLAFNLILLKLLSKDVNKNEENIKYN